MSARAWMLSLLLLCMCTGWSSTPTPEVELLEAVHEEVRLEVGGDEAFTCSGGGCLVQCSGQCKATCSGGGCLHECRAGATCEFACSGGGCNQVCAAGSNCQLSCSGGGCDRDGADARGTWSCSGGGCNG